MCNCFSQDEIIKLRPTECSLLWSSELHNSLPAVTANACNVMKLGRQQCAFLKERELNAPRASPAEKGLACPSTPPFHHRAEMQYTHCHIYKRAARYKAYLEVNITGVQKNYILAATHSFHMQHNNNQLETNPRAHTLLKASLNSLACVI